MAKLDVYPLTDEIAARIAPGVFTLKDKSLTVRLGSFSLSYPLSVSTYRVVLGILRSDDNPLNIQGVSLVYVVVTDRGFVSTPLRVGVTYFRDLRGDYTSSVVVDGFPVFISAENPFHMLEIRAFLERYKEFASL